ncbi:hypothetical protein B0H21DRAFT_710784, partial [Amylocystis lapponica]
EEKKDCAEVAATRNLNVKRNPTAEEIFSNQDKAELFIVEALESLMGHGRDQLGDAVFHCFCAMKGPAGVIRSTNITLYPRHHETVTTFPEWCKDYIKDHGMPFTEWAHTVLHETNPAHSIETDIDGAPLLPTVDMDNTTNKEFTSLLTAYMSRLWAHTYPKGKPFVGLPWDKLDDDSGVFVLANHLPPAFMLLCPGKLGKHAQVLYEHILAGQGPLPSLLDSQRFAFSYPASLWRKSKTNHEDDIEEIIDLDGEPETEGAMASKPTTKDPGPSTSPKGMTTPSEDAIPPPKDTVLPPKPPVNDIGPPSKPPVDDIGLPPKPPVDDIVSTASGTQGDRSLRRGGDNVTAKKQGNKVVRDRKRKAVESPEHMATEPEAKRRSERTRAPTARALAAVEEMRGRGRGARK